MGFHGGRSFDSRDFTPVPRERRGDTVRRIAGFFQPYRWQVLVVMVSIIVTSVLGVINPYLLRFLLDVAIPRQDFTLLNLAVIAMIAIPVISGLIGVGQTYVNNRVGQAVMEDLRNAVYAHLQKMPLRFFTETRTGEIQSRISNDVGGVQSVVTDTASSVFANLVIVVTTLLAMVLLDWRLTAISLTILPFFMYLTFRVGRVRREASKETQKSLADVSALTEETLSVSGILLAKTFGQQDESVRRFSVANARLARLQLRQSLVGRWFFMLVGTVFSVMPAFVYWVAGVLVDPGRSERTDGRRHRRLHHAPEPALLPHRPAAQCAGGSPGSPGPVRPHLRVPGHGARDRGRSRMRSACDRRRSRAGCTSGTSRSPTQRTAAGSWT